MPTPEQAGIRPGSRVLFTEQYRAQLKEALLREFEELPEETAAQAIEEREWVCVELVDGKYKFIQLSGEGELPGEDEMAVPPVVICPDTDVLIYLESEVVFEDI
jgi:hypothetical protein